MFELKLNKCGEFTTIKCERFIVTSSTKDIRGAILCVVSWDKDLHVTTSYCNSVEVL